MSADSKLTPPHPDPLRHRSGVMVLTTVPTIADAERLAAVCIEERLCGCVAMMPRVSSVFRWNNDVTTEEEFQLQCKTTVAALPHLRRRIIELHPYELPAIIEVPVSFGAMYGGWIADETSPTKTATPHDAPQKSSPQKSIVILASGRGSNAQALIENQGFYRISAIITDTEGAPVLSRAAEAKIKGITCSRTAAGSLSACQEQIAATLFDLSPNLIVLAGFMQILKPWFVEQFKGRLLNIHPSLLPAYPGLRTHERVLSAGEPLHGATVHLVDSGVDTGPIIAQVPVSVLSNDTAESLAARVLSEEHRLLPWVVEAAIAGDISWTTQTPRFSESARAEAKLRGFIIRDHDEEEVAD